MKLEKKSKILQEVLSEFKIADNCNVQASEMIEKISINILNHFENQTKSSIFSHSTLKNKGKKWIVNNVEKLTWSK